MVVDECAECDEWNKSIVSIEHWAYMCSLSPKHLWCTQRENGRGLNELEMKWRRKAAFISAKPNSKTRPIAMITSNPIDRKSFRFV